MSAALVLTLVLGACAPTYHFAEFRSRKIEDQAEALYVCLAKNASAFASDNSEASSSAKAVALACKPLNDQLIALMNLDGDPRVTAAMERDAEFRATGYILKARGQAEN